MTRLSTDQRKASRRSDGATGWSAPWAGEPIDRGLAGLGVLARIAELLSPCHEALVQLGEAGDTVGFGLAEEPSADKTVEPLLLAASFRRIGTALDQVDAEAGATALERRVGVRRAVIHVHPFGQAAALNSGT